MGDKGRLELDDSGISRGDGDERRTVIGCVLWSLAGRGSAGCSSINCGREVVDSGEFAILGGEVRLWVAEGDLDLDIQAGRIATRRRNKQLGPLMQSQHIRKTLATTERGEKLKQSGRKKPKSNGK